MASSKTFSMSFSYGISGVFVGMRGRSATALRNWKTMLFLSSSSRRRTKPKEGFCSRRTRHSTCEEISGSFLRFAKTLASSSALKTSNEAPSVRSRRNARKSPKRNIFIASANERRTRPRKNLSCPRENVSVRNPKRNRERARMNTSLEAISSALRSPGRHILSRPRAAAALVFSRLKDKDDAIKEAEEERGEKGEPQKKNSGSRNTNEKLSAYAYGNKA